MSTGILKALRGKLDIKSQSPGILYLPGPSATKQTSDKPDLTKSSGATAVILERSLN